MKFKIEPETTVFSERKVDWGRIIQLPRLRADGLSPFRYLDAEFVSNYTESLALDELCSKGRMVRLVEPGMMSLANLGLLEGAFLWSAPQNNTGFKRYGNIFEFSNFPRRMLFLEDAVEFPKRG